MHSLSRISLSNWYLIDAKDIDISGEAALIGPTGAGKSSIQDAIQTVITGVNQNRLNLNASASGRSSRSVLEYCLGMTGDPSEGGRPLRSACETVIALTFRDEETGEPVTVGVALSARSGDSREEVLSRFIIPGCAYSVDRARRRVGTATIIAPWAEIASGLRKAFPRMEEYKTSAERFTADMLALMRGGSGPAPNAKHFLRAFSNALAFKPIFDPTLFVRDFVLEPDPLDVERVRRSIATWRELEGVIADVEAKLKKVGRIHERFAGWGRARLDADGYRWRSAAADARRAAHEWRAAKKTLDGHAAELQLEKGVLASRREWIRAWDEEIRSKQALVAAAGGESQLRQIKAEATLAGRDLQEAEAAWTRLRRALADLARLAPLVEAPRSGEARAVDAARQALALMPDGMALHDAVRGRGETLAALIAEARLAGDWSASLDERADTAAIEARRLAEDLFRLKEAPTRTGGGAPLSREALKLLSALKSAGIPATPLCDVVEVADPSWQYAAEALLGRGREAIIVEPARLNQAFDLMWSDRNAYAGCTLVKTSATRSTALTPPAGSIVEALKTSDPHARAFLSVRIGAFRKAETDAELDRLERGVMRNGKTSSGMGLSVQRDLKDLLFGRGGASVPADNSANDRAVARLEAEVAAAREKAKILREAARLLPRILDALAAEPGPLDIEHQVTNARLRQAALERDRHAVEENDAASLRAELAHIRAERDAHAQELAEEVEPKIERLAALVSHARTRLGVATATLKTALGLRRKAWALIESDAMRDLRSLGFKGPEGEPAAILAEFRASVREREAAGGDVRSWFAMLRNEAHAAADRAETEARREQVASLRELADYAAQWNVTVPVIEADSFVAGARWVAEELARLDGNELRGYRDTCARAAEEMRRMMREDLLARLSEKLGKVADRLDALNRLLERHRFTGQTYAFTHAVDGRFSGMRDLALKAAQGELTDAVFESSMDEVEAMIEGAEAAADLADYRRYFTFEIVMTDAKGGRTTLSSRAVKGSGGEAQVPFYVAIAASLASAYYPGHLGGGKPKGMGLALFDEAFNKLDVPNTQALLRFFREMGLQLLIAGPEDKRATFTEVLDTIVLVNKSLDGKSVFIDTEHPGEAAKAALAELNPDHRGVEGFRAAAE
ncbi:SbcC/MukB-like Walker B domain-containing protein [Antarcticirhabdus aurantiaca]|uniref:ATPase n=1 Tax=Antarcticirhabdus aurantiaca TaxID=2606717 RepID=A0ACD4NKS8_9HYPH|nr:SbcC/MukB-like Walker B domain-containing protein [Antarcticirhabdus aurantiaca]WAJ27450.1 ATPase [Jeongeuplla avenae]